MATGLILAIDESQRLPVSVLDDEAGIVGLFFNVPRRGKAAGDGIREFGRGIMAILIH